jgi:hypothetical protein
MIVIRLLDYLIDHSMVQQMIYVNLLLIYEKQKKINETNTFDLL